METLRALRTPNVRQTLKSNVEWQHNHTRWTKWGYIDYTSQLENTRCLIIKVLSHYFIQLWFFTWSDQGRAESIPWRSKICRLYASLFCSLQIYQHKKALSKKLIQKAATREGSCLDNASTCQTSSFPYHITLLQDKKQTSLRYSPIWTKQTFSISLGNKNTAECISRLWMSITTGLYPKHSDVQPPQLVSHPKTLNLATACKQTALQVSCQEGLSSSEKGTTAKKPDT